MTTKGAGGGGGGGGGAEEGNRGVLRCARRRRPAFSGRSVRGGGRTGEAGAELPPACRVPPAVGRRGALGGRWGRASLRGEGRGKRRCSWEVWTAAPAGCWDPPEEVGAPEKVGGVGMRGAERLWSRIFGYFSRLYFQLRDREGTGRSAPSGGSVWPGRLFSFAFAETWRFLRREKSDSPSLRGCPGSFFKTPFR